MNSRIDYTPGSDRMEESKREHISNSIRVIPHFPKHGIMFQDVTTLLLDPKVQNLLRSPYGNFAANVKANKTPISANVYNPCPDHAHLILTAQAVSQAFQYCIEDLVDRYKDESIDAVAGEDILQSTVMRTSTLQRQPDNNRMPQKWQPQAFALEVTEASAK